MLFPNFVVSLAGLSGWNREMGLLSVVKPNFLSGCSEALIVSSISTHVWQGRVMRVSAAIPRGRPPGTQGHLSQLPWQIHAKAPRVGQKIGTNTPTPGATWATYSRCCLFLDAKVRVIMVYWSHISTKIHTSLYGVLKFELSGANFLGLRLFITLSLPIGKTLRMRTNRMKLKSRCRFP